MESTSSRDVKRSVVNVCLEPEIMIQSPTDLLEIQLGKPLPLNEPRSPVTVKYSKRITSRNDHASDGMLRGALSLSSTSSSSDYSDEEITSDALVKRLVSESSSITLTPLNLLPKKVESKPVTALPPLTIISTDAQRFPTDLFLPALHLSSSVKSTCLLDKPEGNGTADKPLKLDLDKIHNLAVEPKPSDESDSESTSDESDDSDPDLPSKEDKTDPSDKQKIERAKRKANRKPSGRFDCKTCKKKFTSAELLDQHIQTDLPEQPCKLCCIFCLKPFKWHSRLVLHMKSHTNEKTFECANCGKFFKLKIELHRHEKMHLNERPHKCLYCNMGFKEKIDLMQHVKNHRGDAFHCPSCNVTIDKKLDIQRHIKTHAGIFMYECEVCGKGYTQKAGLKSHLKVHTYEFTCSSCGKSFRDNCSLSAHKTTHTDVRPFACSHCDKTFKQQGQLNRHERIHSNEKRFRCTICSNSFSQNAHLQQHLRNHEGIRPFRCRICRRSFSTRSNLKTHGVRVHGVADC